MLYVAKKETFNSVRTIVLLFYFLFALMGVITVTNGIYFKAFGMYNIHNVSFTPYFINFIMIISLLSLLKINENHQIALFNNNINRIELKILNTFENIIIFFCLLLVLLSLYGMFERSISFSSLYILLRNGDDTFIHNQLLNTLFWKTKYLIGFFQPFVCMLFVSKIAFKKKILAILLSFISLTFSSIVTTSRGAVFFIVFNYIFFLIIFWNRLNNQYKRLIIGIGLLLGIVIVYYIVQISESRFDDNASESVLRYFGEPFPTLGFQIWDVHGNHLMFERKFPTLYNLFCAHTINYDNFNDQVSYFSFKSNYPINNFKPFFGDMYIEYDLILSFIIFLCIFFLLKKLINSNLYNGLSFIYIFLTYEILIWGPFGCKFDESEIKKIFFYLLFILYIKKRFLTHSASTNGCINNHSQLQHLQPFTQLP